MGFLGGVRTVAVLRVAGGIEPAWSPDGNEIFFWSGLEPGDEMRGARVDTQGGFALQSVETLFSTPPGIMKNEDHRLYAVAPDGERFIMVRPLTQGNWGLVLGRDFFQVAREALGGWALEPTRDRSGGAVTVSPGLDGACCPSGRPCQEPPDDWLR